MKKCIELKACLFVWEVVGYDTDGTFLPNTVEPKNLAAYDKLENALGVANFKNPGMVSVSEALMCDYNRPGNLQLMQQLGLDNNNTPAVHMYAEYDDGTAAYLLYKADFITGANYKEEELVAGFTALWQGKTGKVCNIPILSAIPVVGKPLSDLMCRLPAFLWLGALAYTVYQTANSTTPKQKWLNGGMAAGSLYMFNRAGGFSAIKPKK